MLRELLPLAMSKELVTRHGATLAIAEVVAALCKLGHTIPDDVQSTVRNLVPKIEKARLYVCTNATPPCSPHCRGWLLTWCVCCMQQVSRARW